MNDFKNLGLAWFSTASTMFAAVETRDILAIISAVVLPVIFFTVGKAVDVIVQLRLKRNAGTPAGRRQEETPAGTQRGREEERLLAADERRWRG